MFWWMWLIMAGILLIIEIFTKGFLVFWFSVAALVTTVISVFTSNVLIQVLVFVVCSTILLFFTKRFSERVRTTDTKMKFNIDTIIGETGVVEQQVSKLQFGVVKVGGSTWTAVTEGETIEVGQVVVIKSIDGVKLVVERKTEI